jgi:Amt family ammonium transporter
MQLCNGVLCGLVTITPACGVVDPWIGVLMAILGAATFMGMDALMLKSQIDDVVAAVPLHLGCGVLGTLAVGFFAREEYVVEYYGVHPGGECQVAAADLAPLQHSDGQLALQSS